MLPLWLWKVWIDKHSPIQNSGVPQMIIFNQGMLLLGSNLFSFSNNLTQPKADEFNNIQILVQSFIHFRWFCNEPLQVARWKHGKILFFLFSFHCTPCQHKLFGNVTSVQTQQTERKKLLIYPFPYQQYFHNWSFTIPHNFVNLIGFQNNINLQTKTTF